MNRIYKVALSLAKYVGIGCVRRLLEAVDSVEEIFADRASLQQTLPWLPVRALNELYRPGLIEEAKRICQWADSQGVRIIFYADPTYPPRLRECNDSPVVLYAKGRFEDWGRRYMLSVVGTRNMTTYGGQMTERLLSELKEKRRDAVIVSGLAYGVDILAHRKALELGLPTVAVLAHGLDRIYPPRHQDTAMQILESGALLTEYPPGTNPERYNFVGRNRIIAGLSEATLVIEAGLKSGSLLTAEMASDYNREVFALPGRISDLYSLGCNKLIQDNRATLIGSGEEIAYRLHWSAPTGVIQQELPLEGISEPEPPLVSLIRKHGGSMSADDLMLYSEMEYALLQSELFTLEIEGRILKLPGDRYSLI